ncbi:MAG: hypothetical protein HY298_06120 [Verrucomicrobia bacterium]|nr:hypothetical protein [Verrucomicrobiota bacterium]
MNADTKTAAVLIASAVLFLALAAAFQRDLWGRPAALPAIPLVDPAFTNPAPTRVSAAELKQTGGDTSGLECNTCHELNKPVTLKFDAKGQVILPKEHDDLVMHHGRNDRNNNCFNCHNPLNREELMTKDGHKLKIEESTRLCASCHGPTYRDWELGVHGRMSGYWDRALGPFTRLDCVSCHHPHAPIFASRPPAPGPHPLRPAAVPPNPQHSPRGIKPPASVSVPAARIPQGESH